MTNANELTQHVQPEDQYIKKGTQDFRDIHWHAIWWKALTGVMVHVVKGRTRDSSALYARNWTRANLPLDEMTEETDYYFEYLGHGLT